MKSFSLWKLWMKNEWFFALSLLLSFSLDDISHKEMKRKSFRTNWSLFSVTCVQFHQPFYEQLFLFESVLQSFVVFTVWVCNFLQNEIGTYAAHKILVKLNIGVNFTNRLAQSACTQCLIQKMLFSFTYKTAHNFIEITTRIYAHLLCSTIYSVCKKDQRKSNGAKAVQKKLVKLNFGRQFFPRKISWLFCSTFFIEPSRMNGIVRIEKGKKTQSSFS